jgi:hypothetical protein
MRRSSAFAIARHESPASGIQLQCDISRTRRERALHYLRGGELWSRRRTSPVPRLWLSDQPPTSFFGSKLERVNMPIFSSLYIFVYPLWCS